MAYTPLTLPRPDEEGPPRRYKPLTLADSAPVPGRYQPLTIPRPQAYIPYGQPVPPPQSPRGYVPYDQVTSPATPPSSSTYVPFGQRPSGYIPFDHPDAPARRQGLLSAISEEGLPGLEQGLSLGFYQPSWEPTSTAGRLVRGAARFVGELPAYGAAVAGAAAIPGLGEAEAAALMPALMRAGVAGLGLGTVRGIAGVTHGAPLSSIPRTSAEEAAGWLTAELGTRALAPAWEAIRPLLNRARGQSLEALDHAATMVQRHLATLHAPPTPSPSGRVPPVSETPLSDVLGVIPRTVQSVLKQSPALRFADWFDGGIGRLYTRDAATIENATRIADTVNQAGLSAADNENLWNYSNWFVKAKRRGMTLQQMQLHPAMGAVPPRMLSGGLEPKPALSIAAQKAWDAIRPLMEQNAVDYEALKGQAAPDALHVARFVKSDRLENDMSAFMEEGRITRRGVLSQGLRTIQSLQHQNYFHFRSDQMGEYIGQVDKQGRVFFFQRGGGFVNPYKGDSTDVLTEDDLAAAKALFSRRFSMGRLQRARMTGTFTDAHGTSWRVTRAAADEIERDTPWKFYHEVVPNILLQHVRLQRGVAFQRFLTDMLAQPEAAEVVRKLGPGVEIPRGWSRGPGALAGYAFDPIALRAANRWWNVGKVDGPGIGSLRWLAGTARNLIFVLPLLHVSNETVNWTVDRGARWASVPAYQRLFQSGNQALRILSGRIASPADEALWNYYIEAQQAGLKMMRQLSDEHVVPTWARAAGKAMTERPQDLSMAARALGFINPVNLARAWMTASRTITWWLDDAFRLQALFEERALGRTAAEAAARVSEHIPDYVVPTYVAGNETLSRLFRGQAAFVFGPYHYGLLSSYGRWAQALLGKVPLERRAEAAGQLAVLGLLMLWAYPKLDQLAKRVTGNEAAYFGRAGMARVPWNAYRVLTGQTTPLAGLTSVVTPNPLWTGLYVGGVGYNPYTRQVVVEPRASAGQRIVQGATGAAQEAIAPLRYAEEIASGQLSPLTWLASGPTGLQTPKETPAQRKLQTDLYDERQFVLSERTKAFRNGDVGREAELRMEYNQRLLADIAEVMQEASLSPALGQLYFRHYSMKPFSPPSQQRLMAPALPIPMRILRGR